MGENNISTNSDIMIYTTIKGEKKYKVAIWHNELGKHQIVRSDNLDVLTKETHYKMVEWDELWRKQQYEDRERLEFLNKKNHSNDELIKYVTPTNENIWATLKNRLEVGNIEGKINKEYISTLEKPENEHQSDDIWSALKSRLESKNNDMSNNSEYIKTIKELGLIMPEKQTYSLDGLLNQAIDNENTIIWDNLKNQEEFIDPEPIKEYPKKPILKNIPNPPNQMDQKYKPKLGLFGVLSKSRQKSMKNQSKRLYEEDMSKWNALNNEIAQRNLEIMDQYKKTLLKHDKIHEKRLNEWNERKQEFMNNKSEFNRNIDEMEKKYFDCVPEGIINYCELILSNSDYPSGFPKEFALEYKSEPKILIIDYQLPNINVILTLSELIFIKSRNEHSKKHLNKNQVNDLYDRVLYQIVLRTIYELYDTDKVNAFSSIIFNGYVKSIDRSIGKEVNSCILSINASKEDFEEINLAMVEPKACFKRLKGVGSPQLHSITPIAPIIKMDREDKRFVDAYSVVNEIDEGYNLAAMDWEDFENLIREIFEQAYAETGGEVKITQASRDGGVDAVVFDPDPLRGGKTVIQAKRYTNVVGVSAVRDLYGTLMNEGAMKGILVTTSDFGPDAYKFVSNKPIQLINGNNLLNLLEQHGHNARIDLQEAKNTLNQKKNIK